MQVRREDDPHVYAQQVLPLLLRAPARHNLMLGIVDVLRRRPDVYPRFHLWAVTDEGSLVGAALQTPPHNLLFAEPATDDVAGALVDALDAAGERPPGIVAAVPEADAFAEAWAARFGGVAEISTRQGIYELTAVRDPGLAPGAPRRATVDDLNLLADWHEAFISEAVPNAVGDAATRRRRIEGVIEDGGYWLWDHDGPVSMTGVNPAPPQGARVGPVYTPPSARGRGYATALVGHVSADALAAGKAGCYLHTDLANPTSNAIYQRIGYDWVCEAVDLRFVDQSQLGGVGA
jgi:predicted GNAT family acetyltransferase